MEQWVKNLTAAAQVTAEAQAWSPAWLSGLKDPAQIESLAQELPCATGVAIRKKKNRKKIEIKMIF